MMMSLRSAVDPTFEIIEVSAEERALMRAAVPEGMQAVFADDAARGIPNAEEIYNAIDN